MAPVIKDSDVIIHLAAITDAESSLDKKDLVMTVNKNGLENVARLATMYKKKLIFPSTTSVYGSKDNVVDETCLELCPQSPYAESKIWGEKLLQLLGKKTGLKFVIFRFGTIFGYSIGMRFHTAVNKFIFQAINGQPITVWKTAYQQKRPYCDLNDCVATINYTINHNVFDQQIYNIVTVNHSVKEIIEVIKKYVPKLKIKFVESRIMNQLSYNADNTRSLRRGFKYSGNLDRSIRNTIRKLKIVNYESKIS